MANIIGTQTVNGIYILNTDTNPTLTGGVDAPIGSWGLAGDGSGFFYKFGASNTDWEQGASTSSIAGYNVLLVRKNPSVGQYATIEDAINAITAPSTNNRWLILVGVGQFIENTLSPPNYTSIIGASIQETQIFPATATQHIWELGEYNEISFMWLEGAGPGYSAIHVNDSGNYSQAHKVTFNDNDINILVESATQDTFFYGEYLDFNGTYSYGLKVIATGGFRAFANIENYYNYPTGGLAIANHITGPNSDAHLLAGGCEGVNTGTAFYLQDGANLQLTAFNINNFDKGIHNPNVGSACEVLISGVVAKDIVTYDIQIEHLTTSGTIGGAFDDSKISLASNLVSLLVQDTNDGSLLITNKLKVLFSNGTITDVSTLIIEGATMGVERGGTLSDGGGFDVDVLAGNGYFELFPDVDVIKRLDWANTSITLSANVDVFIYFNNNGILVSNGAQPDTRFNILLGRVVTNSTGIEFIDASPLTAEHTSNLILNNLREAIGSIYASGSIVTENVTPLNLDLTSGEYYYGENEFMPSGGTGITFTAIYGQGSGVITGQTAVNNTQYDNAGVLTALTAGYYAKGSLYLIGQGVNEKYYFVFAQAEYSTLLAVQQADIPLPPNYFSGSVVLIAGIIVQQGNPNIVQIIDQRPIIGFRSYGVTASADHLSLLNLNGGVNGDGGHTNMFTVNGSKPMTGNINMATNNILNIGTANGVTIEAHASRHLPNGLDPLTTAAPTTNLSGSSTNAVGIQNSFSRSDHSHAITGAALTKVDDTNVTLSLGGTPLIALLNSASLTLGWTGQLSIARGGTGAAVANDALNNLLPSQALNVGKVLQTDGTNTSWVTVAGALGFTPVNKAGDNGVGLITFLNNQGIDVDVTGGTDVLNIGTSNADIINIGWSGAQVNILGTTFYENVTELQVKDKLFTVNKGGAAGSGASAGFEIEEGGVITGYFATSGTRDGWDFKAPAIASYATLSLANLTANSIFFLPNVANKTLATIDGGQTFTSATWNGSVISEIYGGTNQSTYTTGDVLYASAANTLSKLPIGTAGQVLTVAGGIPIWSNPSTAMTQAQVLVRANINF